MKNLSFLKNINIAHKGIYDNDKIPENSIKAFELAIKKAPHVIVIFNINDMGHFSQIII